MQNILYPDWLYPYDIYKVLSHIIIALRISDNKYKTIKQEIRNISSDTQKRCKILDSKIRLYTSYPPVKLTTWS